MSSIQIAYSNRPAWVLSLLELGFTALTTAFVVSATHKYMRAEGTTEGAVGVKIFTNCKYN